MIVVVAHCNRAFAQERQLADKQPRLFRLEFSGDGQHLLAAGDAIRVFSTESGAVVEQIASGRGTSTLAAIPGHDHLFAEAGEDGIVRIRRVSEPEPVRELKGHYGRARNLAVSPDGKLLASIAGELTEGHWKRSEFRLWDAGSGRLVRVLDFNPGDVSCAAFSQDGNELGLAITSRAAEQPSHIDVYDVRDWKRVRTIEFSPGFARSVYFKGHGGDVLIVGGNCSPVPGGCQPTGTIWMARARSDTAREMAQDRQHAYFLAAQNPAAGRIGIGTALVTATINAKGKVDGARLAPLVQLRDATTGDIIWSTMIEGAGEPAVSPDGKRVAALIERTIYLYEVETGEPVWKIVVTK